MSDIKYRQHSGELVHYWGFIDGVFICPVTSNQPNPIHCQFTGLLDSNGVEIYKGDVILSEHDGAVVVEWSVRAAKFGVHVLRHHTYSIEKKTKLRAIPRDGIVIGNIHQNPELLK
jgi:hypothetical protein